MNLQPFPSIVTNTSESFCVAFRQLMHDINIILCYMLLSTVKIYANFITFSAI